MLPWIEQKGYPVVTVAMSTDRASVAVTQKMFLINPLNGMSDTYPSQYKCVFKLRGLRRDWSATKEYTLLSREHLKYVVACLLQ